MTRELTVSEIEALEIENKLTDGFINDSYLMNSTIIDTYKNTIGGY